MKIYNEDQYLSETAFNHQTPGEGETIAPFVVTWEQVQHDHMDSKTLKTWTLRGGRKVLVAFMVVPRADFQQMMRIYNFMANGHVDEDEENHLSLDQNEENMADPDKKAKALAWAPSVEEVYFASREIDDLIDEVAAMDAKSGEILKLLRDDCSKGDVLKALHLGKSQGYEDIKTAQRLARQIRDQYR